MILCIDTITAESGIALIHDGRAIGFEPLESRHSSDGLFTAIDRLFSEAKIVPSDLNGVLVTKGPGSFTSVRVGIAVANQFAHQLKIPIIGLTADKWYRLKTDETDFLYLQTMNRDEVYGVGFGTLKSTFKTPIFPIFDLPKAKKTLWLGQLSEEHKAVLPQGYHLIDRLKNTQETWIACCDSVFPATRKPRTYDLVEPYYGKEPHITLSKKRSILSKKQ